MNVPKTPEQLFRMAGSENAKPRSIAGGGTIADTPESIERFRMMTILAALKLQCKGIQAFKGRSAMAVARQLYGIQARTAQDSYNQLREKMLFYRVIRRSSEI